MDGRDEVISKQQQEEGYSSQTVIKGKRTKRQRPQSPIPFRMITPPSDEGSDICSNNNHHHHDVISDDDGFYRSGITTTTATDEEEDMANCLILLAQGRSGRENPSPPPPPPQQPKFTSRKFMEVVATGGKSGGGGYYVYECKTCSKTFPSFQALGGHRASHKKPKIKEEDKNDKKYNTTNRINTMDLMLTSDEEDPPLKPTIMSCSSSPLSLQLTNRALYNASAGSRPRVHECSICGAEFSSGQALGGHMRRHRGLIATPVSAAVATTVEEGPAPEVVAVGVIIREPTTSSTLSLDLDLNLPAPAEDDVLFASKQPQPEQPLEQPPPSLPQQIQQQQLVFSSRPLVDCHY